jgi:hypothetical protein
MAESSDHYATWLPVIGRSLAYLCLDIARRREPGKLKEILNKMEFLEGLGLPQADAAEAAGSTAESVRVARYNKSKAKKSGKKISKKARVRRR